MVFALQNKGRGFLWHNQKQVTGPTRKDYMYFAQEASDIGNLPLQKLVQYCHVSLLPKEDIVGEVLQDLTDHHQPSTHSGAIFGW